MGIWLPKIVTFISLFGAVILASPAANALPQPVETWRYLESTPTTIDNLVQSITLYGFLSEPPKRLSESHEATKWAQAVVDVIWSEVAKSYDIRRIPRPIVSIQVNPASNGFVAPVAKCIKVRLGRVSGPALSAENKQWNLPTTLFFNDIERPVLLYSAKDWRGREEKKIPCDYSMNLDDAQAFLTQFNSRIGSKCTISLDQNSSPAILSLDGDCIDTKLTHLDEMAFMGSANVITLNSGLLNDFKMNPIGILGIVAHEIAHYVRAHSSVGKPQEYNHWYYYPEDRTSAAVPARRSDLQGLGEQLQLAGGMDWVNPSFLGLRLDPLVGKYLDNLVDMVRGTHRATRGSVGNDYDENRKPNRKGLGERQTDYTLNDVCQGQGECLIACAPFRDTNFNFKFAAYVMQFPPGQNVSSQQVKIYGQHQEAILACAATIPLRALRELEHHDYLIFPKLTFEEWAMGIAFNLYTPMGGILSSEVGNYKRIIDIIYGIDAHFKRSRQAFTTASATRLQMYTSEEEADELAMNWMAGLGLNPSAFENIMHQLYQNVTQLKRATCDANIAWPKLGETSPATCNAIRKRGWVNSNGERAYIQIDDYSLKHHPGCYRLARMHEYRTRYLNAEEKSVDSRVTKLIAAETVARALKNLPPGGQRELVADAAGGIVKCSAMKVEKVTESVRGYADWIIKLFTRNRESDGRSK